MKNNDNDQIEACGTHYMQTRPNGLSHSEGFRKASCGCGTFYLCYRNGIEMKSSSESVSRSNGKDQGSIARSQENCEICKEQCWVRLVPFENQVSGHHRVMLLDAETICKPLMLKEFEFYRNMPEQLAPFTPTLKGVAKACGERVEDGKDLLLALPLQSIDEDVIEKRGCQCHKKRHYCWTQQQSDCTEKVKWKYICGESNDNTEVVFDGNPWVLQVQQMSFERNMHKSVVSKFILLENVGNRFNRPCIMDLKMGTRQYGDDATDTKIKGHKERCEQSTSGSLGVRLCGMQVYNPTTSTYTYTDKYTGRNLDPAGFKNCLRLFLNNGLFLNIIHPIVESLIDLYHTIKNLETCRFFGSSLLLMYDGAVEETQDPRFVIRMIDFAQVTLFDEKHLGPDDGYLFGLQNLTDLLQEIENEIETKR